MYSVGQNYKAEEHVERDFNQIFNLTNNSFYYKYELMLYTSKLYINIVRNLYKKIKP